jgi:predicted nucleotidyltransferase
MSSQSKALQVLSEVHDACMPIFNNSLNDAYLYGSYARGDYHMESDIDILLVVDLEPSEICAYRKKIAAIASDLSLKHDVTVSITVKPLAQFKKYVNVIPFYKNVIEEGIRYGA